MAKGNSLDSWIDPERMEELLGIVRPGSLERSSLPAVDLACSARMAEDPGPPSNEKLLLDEIPERAFVKGGTMRLGTPVEVVEPEMPVEAPASEPRPINPLNLYFHSTAPSPEARAREFVKWVLKTGHASSACVVDAYGASIASAPQGDPVFLAALSNLADALGRGRDHFSRPDQSALHLEIAEGEILCLVQAKWEVATVALGMIRPAPLPREAAIRYREELGKLAHQPRQRPRD